MRVIIVSEGRAVRKDVMLKSWLLSGAAGMGCVVFLAAPAAQAQDQGGAQLEPIVVQGSSREDPKAPVAGFVATSSATATKTGTPLLQTPQSISVITLDQIKALTDGRDALLNLQITRRVRRVGAVNGIPENHVARDVADCELRGVVSCDRWICHDKFESGRNDWAALITAYIDGLDC